ncbi:MAG: DUF58 domain-containing protein [Nitrospirota bacterium]
MKTSKEGKRFILVTGLITLAALNTANNLIYLILSMMLSIFMLSVLIMKINIKGLVLRIFQSQPIFANSPANINIILSNKKRIASYSIKVLMPENIIRTEKFSEIHPSMDILKPFSIVYKKRGIYRYGDFFIESGFPFIFFSEKILCKVTGEIIVYPEIKEINGIILEIIKEWYEPSLARVDKGDEFSMIREFRSGDECRRIHWKSSAKRAKLMVKEYAAEEPRKVSIILDNLMPYEPANFEKAVSFAASVSDWFLNEGFFVRLFTCRKIMPFGNGRDHLFKILDLLAVIEGQDSWECPISDDIEGHTILILNSADSHLVKFIPFSNMVVYATNL